MPHSSTCSLSRRRREERAQFEHATRNACGGSMTSTPEPFAQADAPRLATPSGRHSKAAPSRSNQGTPVAPSPSSHPQTTWRDTTMNEELPESTHANIIALEVMVKSVWVYVLWRERDPDRAAGEFRSWMPESVTFGPHSTSVGADKRPRELCDEIVTTPHNRG